jgi:hypothetical protein
VFFQLAGKNGRAGKSPASVEKAKRKGGKAERRAFSDDEMLRLLAGGRRTQAGLSDGRAYGSAEVGTGGAQVGRFALGCGHSVRPNSGLNHQERQACADMRCIPELAAALREIKRQRGQDDELVFKRYSAD